MYDVQTKPYLSTATNCVLRNVPIYPDDVVVDIGSGTGEIPHNVWKQVQMKNPILCVDPSKDMLEVASKKDGLDTLLATAEDFFSPKFAHISFNKVLMCGCIYFFTDPVSVFTNLKERLPADGVCIVTYATNISPLPAEIWQYFNQRNYRREEDCKIFDTVGLKWRLVEVAEKVSSPKSVWYNTLRSRGFYSLNRYSDEQLEEEIAKMEEQYRGQEMLDVEVEVKATVLTKI